MKMHLKMTLYHKLAVAKIFFTDETKTEAKSTKFKVTPDKKRCLLDLQLASILADEHTCKGKTLPSQSNTN